MKLKDFLIEEDFNKDKKKPSLAKMIRKAIGVRGQTTHSGRGTFDMEASEDVSFDQIKQKFERLIPRWESAGYIENVDITDDHIEIMFSDEHFDVHYRNFRTNRKIVDEFGGLGNIVFTMSKRVNETQSSSPSAEEFMKEFEKTTGITSKTPIKKGDRVSHFDENMEGTVTNAHKKTFYVSDDVEDGAVEKKQKQWMNPIKLNAYDVKWDDGEHSPNHLRPELEKI